MPESARANDRIGKRKIGFVAAHMNEHSKAFDVGLAEGKSVCCMMFAMVLCVASVKVTGWNSPDGLCWRPGRGTSGDEL